MKKESEFQKKLIEEIKQIFPNCIVIKNDSTYIQGIPDITILTDKGWALLECKRNKNSSHQPNQDYYISKAKEMKYASFVYPENKEDVLNELQSTL